MFRAHYIVYKVTVLSFIHFGTSKPFVVPSHSRLVPQAYLICHHDTVKGVVSVHQTINCDKRIQTILQYLVDLCADLLKSNDICRYFP